MNDNAFDKIMDHGFGVGYKQPSADEIKRQTHKKSIEARKALYDVDDDTAEGYSIQGVKVKDSE